MLSATKTITEDNSIRLSTPVKQVQGCKARSGEAEGQGQLDGTEPYKTKTPKYEVDHTTQAERK